MIYLEPSPQSVWDKKALIKVYNEGTTHTIGMVTTNAQWIIDWLQEQLEKNPPNLLKES